MPHLEIHLFGAPQLVLDGNAVDTDRRKTIALLAYLAMNGSAHSRASLATLLWPDYDTGRAFAYLRRTLWELNQALGEGWLEVDRERVGMKAGADVWLDVAVFRRQLAGCQPGEPAASIDQAATECLAEAVALYRGDFMAGFGLPDSPEFDDWQSFEAESLRQELSGALERLALAYARRGDFEAASAQARRRLALDPLQEAAHRLLMELYARAGQRPAALRQYESCRQLLEQELGVLPQPETTALHDQIKAGTFNVGPSPLIVEPVSNNLPHQLTPFVGRRQELEEIGSLLESPGVRLLTLIGPGGIGKTRLAIQAALEKAGAFADGAWFIPLAPVTETEGILPALAKGLKFSFRDEGGEPWSQLLDYLRRKQMLLVLDNFEHLIQDESVRLVVELLSAAAGAKALVTSRTSLRLQGEHLFPVTGMRTPEAGQAWKDPEELRAYSAVQLYVQSAQRVQPGFKLTADHLASVARICQLVQGMPLGIELAAGWSEVLSPAEIAAEIQDCLDFLETELREVPERQRSLRAVFNASWRLLSPEEQRIFSKLAVFRGGFTRQAAQEVAGASLRSLVDLSRKSFVQRGRGERSRERFQFHELLRQYALEQLQADPQTWNQVLDRHSAFYCLFLAATGERMTGPEQKAALEEVVTEFENVQAGWRWAVEQGRLERIEQALFALYYAASRIFIKELEELLELAIVALEKAPTEKNHRLLQAKLHALLGWILYDRVSNRPAELFRRALALARESGEEHRLGVWYSLLAAGYGSHVDPAEGIRRLHANLAVLREGSRRWETGVTLQMLGNLLASTGELVQAREAVTEAIDILKPTGDRLGLAFSLNLHSAILARERDYRGAARVIEESLQIFKDMDDWADYGINLIQLGDYHMSLGEYERAFQHYQAAREAGAGRGYLSIVAVSLSWESIATRRMGDYARARELRRECLEIALEANVHTDVVWSYWELGDLERVEGNYAAGRQLFDQSQQLYQESTLLDVKVYYHRGLGDLALDQEDFATARQEFEHSLASARQVIDITVSSYAAAYALQGLGRAELGLGDYPSSRRYFQEALSLAKELGDVGLRLAVLAGISSLSEALGEHERAVELAAFILHHPAAWQETKDQAAAVLSRSASRLPAQALSAAQVRGRAGELEAVIDALLASAEA